MESSASVSRLRRDPYLGLLLLILFCILGAGLYPRGWGLHNDVRWDADGLRFGKYGVAFTRPCLTSADSNRLTETGFTLHVAFRLPNPTASGFNTLLLFYNGDSRSQLLLGQWRDILIVMNGDDYDHRRGTPRLGVDTSALNNKPLFLTLIVRGGTPSTSLYLNGELRRASKTIGLTVPAGMNPARLVLGNSVYADGSFQGSLSGLAMVEGALTDEEVREHYEQWRHGAGWTGLASKAVVVAYRFDALERRVTEHSVAQRVPLEIPTYSAAVERRFLALPSAGSEARLNALFDVVLNLLGFVPFGLLATAAVWQRCGVGPTVSLVIVTLTGGLLSLGIEYAQAWMPSRSSSLTDLVLNVAGAAAGSLLALLISRLGGRGAARPVALDGSVNL